VLRDGLWGLVSWVAVKGEGRLTCGMRAHLLGGRLVAVSQWTLWVVYEGYIGRRGRHEVVDAMGCLSLAYR
jgi:hypothetical protein